MKTTSHPAAAKAAVLAICAIAAATPLKAQGNGNGNGNSGSATMIPSVPGGWLTAFPTIVQTGTKPTLTWSITYPSTVASYVRIDNTSRIVTLEQLDIDIRVVGSGVTTGGSGGTNSNWVPAQALISRNGGTFLSIFYGTNPEVNPDQLVWSQRVNKGTILDFGGRYYSGSTWGPTFTSSATTGNIRVLRNGEIPPTVFNLQTSGTLKSFMAPYLDGGGKVKIGPLDLLVMMELTQTDANAASPFYNLQDMVLLVTCRPKSNNGHGNNIDGVDSSNPGRSKPVDPSGTIDDERR